MTDSFVVQKTYNVMGGEFRFMCYPQNFHRKDEVEELFDRAFLEVKRIEDKFTDFKKSEFNQINELSGVRPCPVDDEIFDLIKKSIEISDRSNGLFDITYASIGHAWRVAKEKGMELSSKDREALLGWIDYRRIEMDEKAKTVYLPHKEIKIGLGGIGKGYAVDCAFDLLKKAGLYNFYVNGSGDIRVHSNSSAPRMWKIGIQNPLSPDESKSVGVIQIANGAVATSGSYVHKVENSNKELDHHILNPSTGRSCNYIISATILSDTCLTSDTIATIVMNMSPEQARDYLNRNQIFGAIINKDGRSYLSDKALKSFGK